MNFRTALLFALGMAFALPSTKAQADCRNSDAAFCASFSLQVNGGVRRRAAPPPPPRRSTAIADPWAQPRRRVVVVRQPAPPPPQVVYVQERPRVASQASYHVSAEALAVPPGDRYRHRKFGVHLRLAGMFGSKVKMGGVHGALRIRPTQYFALDLGVGAYGGSDFNQAARLEIPLTIDALFFLTPRSRVQLYVLGGVGTSFAVASNNSRETRGYQHVGGEVGLGVEWRLTERFALSSDIRGFIRTRVDSNPEPEFFDPDHGSSNTSVGALFSVGGTLYY